LPQPEPGTKQATRAAPWLALDRRVELIPAFRHDANHDAAAAQMLSPAPAV
jgi:hypothetical protein